MIDRESHHAFLHLCSESRQRVGIQRQHVVERRGAARRRQRANCGLATKGLLGTFT